MAIARAVDPGDASEPGRHRTIADRVREERRRCFVGRTAVLADFGEALAQGETPFSVLFLHGPGGIGKTSLLERMADIALGRGIEVVHLDLKAISIQPASVLRELGDSLGIGDPNAVLERLAMEPRRIVLLDTYELAAPLDAWFRHQLVPALNEKSMVVIAGRHPPRQEWKVDPGWSRLVRTVALRNLDAEDARAYLALRDVPQHLHEKVIDLTHGHPLALSLVSELSTRSEAGEVGNALVRLEHRPDLVQILLENLVERIPTQRHRDALHVCAHARFTTERLLRDVLGELEGAELISWLRELSFIEESSRGLSPHDLAREALEADLRWRDAARYEQLHKAIRAHLVARARETRGPGRHALVADVVFLNRANPFAATFWQWRTFGDVYADRPRTADRPAILEMVERHEGPESAAIAAHWLERQPDGFQVLRGRASDGPVGFGCILALHRASAEEIEADPGASAMWAYARREGAIRPGDKVFASRFYMDRDVYQSPSASYNAITVAHTQEMLTRDGSTLELIGLFADPERIEPLMSYIDYRRVPAADFEVGGTRYGVFAHDWRQVGVEEWLEVMSEREVAAGFEPAPPALTSRPTFSYDDYAAAVRQALRDLHRPERLARSPLLGSRLIGGTVDRPVDALRDVLERAIHMLAADPRDRKLERALERTFLHPAQTQELAAEALDLPFSTYKRHLKLGIERVMELLWRAEVSGGLDLSQ